MTLSAGLRLRTAVGLARAGTLVRVYVDEDNTPNSVDVAWDDDQHEICAGMSARLVAPLGVVDQLGSLVAA